MRLKPQEVVSDRYEILELIGVGGMANVYCARDLRLGRKVSLKVLKEDFVDEEFIIKLSKEARAAAGISHVNIASVYDVGNDGDIHYIVMEYIDGYTLKDIIKAKAPFTNEEVLGISIQIANALEMAHNKHIVHRDIKPQNILVTKDGGIKVTDFGIARATTANTITTDTMGSVHYFSPEQARGGYVDFKSDIYSLGIIMFEMITGVLPFDGDGVVQLAMKHINDPLPNIREINPKVSNSLEKIILKATSKNGDTRYKTAVELNNDLKKALSDSSGNFVKDSNFIDEDCPTIVIKPEDIEQIKRMSQNKLSEENTKTRGNLELQKNNRDNPNKKRKLRGSPPKLSNRDDKSMEKKVTIWAIVASLILIVVVTGFLIGWFLLDSKSKVPDFKGKTWEQAVALAKDKEIYITNVKEEYSEKAKEGEIIEQDVKAGEKVKKGSTVNVTISLGTGQFEVKDFTGMDISEVYKKIETLNIDLKEEYVYNDKVELGKVVRQIPSGGSKLKPGEDLTLYISRGEEKENVGSIVPYLVGLDERSAKSKIKSEGLSIGKISRAPSDTVEAGNVIEQSIKSGREVLEGTSISIVISSGKKETTTTTTKETTTEKTTAQPIIEETILESSTEIISQEQIETTTEIITEAPTETTTSQPVLKSDVLVINPILPDGIENVEVKVIEIVDGHSKTIWSNNHSASSFPLSINVSGYKPTQYELYINGTLIGTETRSFN